MLAHVASVFKLRHKGRSPTVSATRESFFLFLNERNGMYSYQYSTLIFTPILLAVALTPSAAA